MKKISLNLDSLSVESFETTPVLAEGRGTVHGHVSREYDGCLHTWEPCYPMSASNGPTGCDTCLVTCGYTCDDYSCEPGQNTCAPCNENTWQETCAATEPC